MVAFEIETTGRQDGSWGYLIHRYEKGRGYGTVYLGEFMHGGGHPDCDSAFEAGRRALDLMFGAGGWEFA